MQRKAQMLSKLAKLAEIRSDTELRRFAAFRSHIDALTVQQVEARSRLAGLFVQDDAFSIEGARMANQEAGRLAREGARLDAELDRLRPGYDVARQRAMREFGRVRALEQIAAEVHAKTRKSNSRN